MNRRRAAPVCLALVVVVVGGGAAGCHVVFPAVALMAGVHSATTPLFARGSLARDGRGRALGRCVEVRAERYRGADGAYDEDFHGFAVRWTFGNACERPQRLALNEVHGWVREPSGGLYAVAAVDEGHQIVPLQLDAQIQGSEVIEYASALGRVSAQDAPPSAGATPRGRAVCFDLAQLTELAPGAARPAPLCVPTEPDEAVP